MVNTSGLSSFFQIRYAEKDKSYAGYASGYQSSNLDVLLQKAGRSKTISESKIWDFIQVENDPNFSRKANQSKYKKLVSKLSATSAIATTISSQVHMARIHEFFPTNVTEFLFNISAVLDTNINLLQSFEDFSIFTQIEQVFLTDLEFQFGNKIITFQQLVNLSVAVFDNLAEKDSIKNNGIRPLLALGLQNFLPDSMSGIFTTLSYIDLLDTTFTNDSLKSLFDSELQILLGNLSQFKINDYVLSSNYTEEFISFSDPLGLNLQSKFESELSSEYSSDLKNGIEEINTRGNYGLTVTDISQLVDLFVADINTNIDSAFKGTVGLPSLLEVSQGLSIEAHNNTKNSINSAFDTLAASILTASKINTAPVGTRPLDHLINVKTNIEKRIEYKRRGATIDQFTIIDNYLSSVIGSGNQLTEAALEDLSNILIENNVV